MGMSGAYGTADREESIATIHAALEAGITLLDTGDFYGMGHNELLITDALAGRSRDEALISVKFGAQRGPDASWLGYDARPAALKTALAYSLQRLRTDHIDVYRPARLDADVPIEETVGAIAEMVQAGYVRHIGLSEVGAETIRRAAAVHPICDLQIEYSLISRGIERAILPACRELGIGITAYGVLSRGLISGRYRERLRGRWRGYRPLETNSSTLLPTARCWPARGVVVTTRPRPILRDLTCLTFPTRQWVRRSARLALVSFMPLIHGTWHLTSGDADGGGDGDGDGDGDGGS